MTRFAQRLLLAVVASTAAAVVVGLGLVAAGTASVVITHGVSMEPVYRQGDLVVILERSSYDSGDIAAYSRPGHAQLVLHRIVGGDARGYTFKGDNNASTDPTKPPLEQLAGRAVLHVPQVGLWFRRLTSPLAVAVTALVLIAAGGTTARTRRNRKRRTSMSRHAAGTALSHARLAHLSAPFRGTAVMAAAVGAASLIVGAAAWHAPAAIVESNPAPPPQSMTFAYSTSVPLTAAYDGVTATSPDPIFRKLADSVDVHLDYQGSTGTIALHGELSTPSGWHTIIPLAPVTAFTEARHRTNVTLNLTDLEQKADAAAAAIGIPAGQISVKVTADVQAIGQPSFTPALALTLSPLQLALPGGAAALVVRDLTVAPVLEQSSGELSLLGRTVSVSAARAGSAAGLLVSLLVFCGVVLVARRSKGSEAAGIRRRYASLLVAVEPMPNAAGHPVVDVTKFATLAKLAERYGLLVLHWSRSGVDTFVVQDQGTTFRFRSGSGPAPATSDADANAAVPVQEPDPAGR